MTVYSVRLDLDAVQALKLRAQEKGLPVAMVLRAIIRDYLLDRETDQYLSEMEDRIVATINRLNRTQLQVRRVADISVAQGEWIRRNLDLLYAKESGADLQEILPKHWEAFSKYLPLSLASTGEVRTMIRKVMEPVETPTEGEGARSND